MWSRRVTKSKHATLAALLEMQAHVGLSERGLPSFLEKVPPPVWADTFPNFLSFSSSRRLSAGAGGHFHSSIRMHLQKHLLNPASTRDHPSSFWAKTVTLGKVESFLSPLLPERRAEKYAYFKNEKGISKQPKFHLMMMMMMSILSLWFGVPLLDRLPPVLAFSLSSMSLKWQRMIHPTHEPIVTE